MKILSITIICVFYFLALSGIEACTRMFWNENNQDKIVARTMDLFISDEPQMWLNPRGLHYRSEIDDNGLAWTSLYGNISISAFHMKNLITDGLNECGLAMHALALTITQYEERDSRPGIHYGEWIQYILGTCRTVEEALKAHNHFQVVPLTVNGFIWPLHLMIEDVTGDSAIIEFIEGKMIVYQGSQYQVGTNDPTYDKQLENLATYEKFGGYYSLPTGTDSTSRFVLASAYLKELPIPKNKDEAISLIKQSIERVFQKDNVSKNNGVSFMGNELRTFTLWTSIADLTHRTYYFFPTGQNYSINFDLAQLDFSEGKQIQELSLLETEITASELSTTSH